MIKYGKNVVAKLLNVNVTTDNSSITPSTIEKDMSITASWCASYLCQFSLARY